MPTPLNVAYLQVINNSQAINGSCLHPSVRTNTLKKETFQNQMKSVLARTLNRITVTKPMESIDISMKVYLLTTDLDKQSLKHQIEISLHKLIKEQH